ncbi:MAG: hypothetical protein Q9161_007924 [Pseudevernia consocians]
MSIHFVPSDCGQRLLPTLVDQLSTSDPERVFLPYPSGTRPIDGYRDVTYREFAAAINRCSWWLDKHLGRSDDLRTLTYLGSRDLRSTVVMYSAVKTGQKVLLRLLSTLLSYSRVQLLLISLGSESVEEDLQILEDLQCDVMLSTAESKSPIAEEMFSRRTMRTMTIPALEELLMTEEGPVYPYTKMYSQAKGEPFVVMHISGSTGRPKPASLNHGTVAHPDLFLSAPTLGGKALNVARFSGKRVLFGLPHFHSAAVCFLAFSIYSNTILVLLPSPVSAELVNEAHSHARIDASFLAPSTLADIIWNPEYFDNLKHLQYLAFGGSPLPQEIGNKVKDLVHLFVSFGTTECGLYALEETEPDDWQYASFSPIMGCELRAFSERLYELFFVRSDDPQKLQGVFSTFPSLEEYSAKDLYSKHPTKEGLWLYEARKDDVLIFSDTHKFCPQETECILNAHPAVNSALVCGHGRLKAALLIEAKSPPDTKEERSALLQEIWPSIDLANKKASSSYEQITDDLILFTSMTRPMVRAAKGSVLRDRTVELYTSNLDQACINDAKASQC